MSHFSMVGPAEFIKSFIPLLGLGQLRRNPLRVTSESIRGQISGILLTSLPVQLGESSEGGHQCRSRPQSGAAPLRGSVGPCLTIARLLGDANPPGRQRRGAQKTPVPKRPPTAQRPSLHLIRVVCQKNRFGVRHRRCGLRTRPCADGGPGTGPDGRPPPPLLRAAHLPPPPPAADFSAADPDHRACRNGSTYR